MSKTKSPPKAEIVKPEKAELAADTESARFTISRDDINVSKFNVKQNSSGYDAGSSGSLVYNMETEVVPPNTTSDIIFVDIKKYWMEDVGYENDIKPRIAETEEEAKTLEEESEFVVRKCADLTFLVPQPDDCEDDSPFTYALGDKNYAFGKMFVWKGAYRGTYEKIATFLVTNLNAECEDMCWTFRTVEQEFKRNRWMEPRVDPCNKPVPQEAKDLAVRMRAILA